MKELSTEQKARAYDEAIKKARNIVNSINVGLIGKDSFEAVFPELRESEDERIRKLLLEAVTQVLQDQYCYNRGVSKEKVVAWLEKQCRNPYSGVSFEYNGNVWGMCARDNGVDILFNKKLIQHISGEKQGEQKDILEDAILDSNEDGLIAETIRYENEKKLVDKVEPKFHEGDWIVFNGLTLQVKRVVKGFYITTSIDSITNGYGWDIDNAARLWTIQEAKDGDVLVLNNEVFIYAHRKQMYSIAVAHCFVDNAGSFYLDGEFGYKEYGKTISPATKEQRDLLFQKMKEKGYRWDFDKKELKKIEQNPAWSEKDEINSNICIRLMQTHSLCDKNIITWFESLKYRVQPKQDSTDRFFEGFKKGEQSVIENYGKYGLCKPTEWSEEDEMHIRELESLVKQVWATAEHKNDKNTIHKMSDLSFFLKTFKPQQKPVWSEEDDKKAERIIRLLQEAYDINCINGSIDWLKSLRHQNSIVTDEELAQAKKEAYNDALDKIEYHNGEPTFDDGWDAAIWYLKKRNALH